MPDTSFIGEIVIDCYNFTPRNFLPCSGQSLSINQFTSLYSIIGPMYGGNSTSSFTLPDLRHRVPVHSGQGPGLPNMQLSTFGGSSEAVLTEQMLPEHTHQMQSYVDFAPSNQPQQKYLGMLKVSDDPTSSVVDTYIKPENLSPSMNMNFSTIGITGDFQEHENQQPYLALQFCICVFGIYPPRS